MTGVKRRIKRLEDENSQLELENAQLRQFTVEGFTVAKNFQGLAEEREKLTSDLADKADQLRQLIQINKELKSKL